MAKPISIAIEDESFFGHPVPSATYEVTLVKRIEESEYAEKGTTTHYDVMLDGEAIGTVQKIRTTYQTFSNTVYATGERTRTEWSIGGAYYRYRTLFIRAAEKLGYRYHTYTGWNPSTRQQGIERIVKDFHIAKCVAKI